MNILNFEINSTVLNAIVMVALVSFIVTVMAYSLCQRSEEVGKFISIRYRKFKVKAKNINFFQVIVIAFLMLIGWAIIKKDNNKSSEVVTAGAHTSNGSPWNETSRKEPSNGVVASKKQLPHPPVFGKDEMVLPLNEVMLVDDGNFTVRCDGNRLFFGGNVIGLGKNEGQINGKKNVLFSPGDQIHITTSKNKSLCFTIMGCDSNSVRIDTAASSIKPASNPYRHKATNFQSSKQAPQQNKKDTLVYLVIPGQFVLSQGQ